MSLDWDRLSPALESAAVAVGRLDGVLHRHRFRDAFLWRDRLDAALRCCALDGLIADRDRVLGALIEVPLKPLRDYGAQAQALRLMRALGPPPLAEADPDEQPDPLERQVSGALELLRSQSSRRAAIASGAEGLEAWLRQGGAAGAGHVAFARYLAERGLTSGIIPSVTAASLRAAQQWAQGDRTAWPLALAETLISQCQSAMSTLAGVGLTGALWHQQIGHRRRSSRLPELVDVALAMPMLSAALVARVLGCSVRGAAFLLKELVDLGILTEISGRQTWKAYVAHDVASVRERVRARGQRRSVVIGKEADARHGGGPRRDSQNTPPVVAVDLSGLLSDTDRAIRRAARALEAHGARPVRRVQ